MYKKDDGTIDEPTMYNIKGGGEWYDASYHGLLVESTMTSAKRLIVSLERTVSTLARPS